MSQPRIRKPHKPAEWREKLNGIECPRIRRHAACVVFWDVLSVKMDKMRERGYKPDEVAAVNTVADLVDESFMQPSVATEFELYEALKKIGYSAAEAFRRSREKCKANSNRGHGKTRKPTREGYVRKTSRVGRHSIEA